ncbi:MAG: prepilin-type N-terminal cleavage/methylation domain-containing protein [Variibacter sp.]|nr:prepilin-type N-terminal cleavage/methylation domain-containing protein [Variibacter sp.]
MTVRHKRRGSPGFTLIEAVIATALMAIIIGALATVTAQWLPNWNRGFGRLQGAELFATGLDRVLADLSAAEFVSLGSRADSPPAFDGRELSVTLVRTTLGPSATTGLEIVRLAETASGGAMALVRSTAPFFPNDQDARVGEQLAFANPVVVIRAPYRVTFSYAGPDHAWRDTWRDGTSLPRAVRVLVRDAASSRTLAVSAATIVRAELPPRCVIASTTAGCPMLGAAVRQDTAR